MMTRPRPRPLRLFLQTFFVAAAVSAPLCAKCGGYDLPVLLSAKCGHHFHNHCIDPAHNNCEVLFCSFPFPQEAFSACPVCGQLFDRKSDLVSSSLWVSQAQELDIPLKYLFNDCKTPPNYDDGSCLEGWEVYTTGRYFRCCRQIGGEASVRRCKPKFLLFFS